jgi:hypothetical protein
MAVTSKPLGQEPIRITRARYELNAIVGALIGLLIGAVVWIFGARYTVDGLILGSNTILSFLTIPLHIAPRWEYYLYLAPLPILFSAVEWTCSPFGRNRVTHGGLIMAWVVVVAIDTASTLIGLASATTPAFIVWIVSSITGIVILSIVLTFGPELMMKSCGGLLWRALRSLFNYR